MAWDELLWIAAPTAVVLGLILALKWRGAGERDGVEAPEATETAETGEGSRRE